MMLTDPNIPCVTFELPFPNARLNPNRANGRAWQARNSAKRAAIETAYFLTQQAMAEQNRAPYVTRLELEFCPPNARRRDLDNLLAAMKPSIDGIAAALGIDDVVFRAIVLRRGDVCGGGKVIVRIA
jgi:crossover junction endodeoxyribonuclease RusA